MNDTEYLKKKNALNDELLRAGSTEPFDFDRWNSALLKSYKLYLVRNRRRRTSRGVMSLVILAAIVFAAYLFYLLLCEASI